MNPSLFPATSYKPLGLASIIMSLSDKEGTVKTPLWQLVGLAMYLAHKHLEGAVVS